MCVNEQENEAQMISRAQRGDSDPRRQRAAISLEEPGGRNGITMRSWPSRPRPLREGGQDAGLRLFRSAPAARLYHPRHRASPVTLAFQVGRMWLRSPEDEGGGRSSTTDRRGESPCRRVGAGRLPSQPECRGGPAVPIDHRSSAGRRGLSTGEARGFPSTGRPSRASAGRLAFLPRVRGGRP